jgi:hypothetical protein
MIPLEEVVEMVTEKGIEHRRASAAWMWLAIALMVVLVIGAVGVAIWQGGGEGDGEASGFPTGTFVAGGESVEFNEDGACRWFATNGAWELPRKYAVNGDLYTEMWFEWPAYGAEQFFPATYYWTYDGENLTFELWGVDANSSRRASYAQTLVRSE